MKSNFWTKGVSIFVNLYKVVEYMFLEPEFPNQCYINLGKVNKTFRISPSILIFKPIVDITTMFLENYQKSFSN